MSAVRLCLITSLAHATHFVLTKLGCFGAALGHTVHFDKLGCPGAPAAAGRALAVHMRALLTARSRRTAP